MSADPGKAESGFWPVVVPAACLILMAVACYFAFGLPKDQNREAVGKVAPKGDAPAKMLWIPGGTFKMGSDHPAFRDAKPVHDVTIDGFWLDEHEVTNAEFRKFVEATGYVTIAEQKPDPREFPGVPEEVLVPGSIVFLSPGKDVPLNDPRGWQHYVPGACWKHPEGPGSDIKGRENHPAVHIAWDDADAYAKWAGKRLPTEAEWEYAARAGLDQKPFVWGDDKNPGNRWMANIWQGKFPAENLREDGHYRTAPVKSYPPNAFGVYDISGNVWEWCADWYRPDYYRKSPRLNPEGPPDSYDPQEPDPGAARRKRVQRGGSFLCSDLYCIRYMPGGRGKGDVHSSHSHVGFRCAKSSE